MTLTELRTAYDKIIEKQKMSNTLYDNYLFMKKLSNKQAKLSEILQEGILFYNKSQYNMAYEVFTKAISFEADADAFHNRGTTCMDLRNLNLAIHDFTAAIIFCPTYAPPYFNRGLCFSQVLSDNDALNDYRYSDIKEFAKKDFRKAIELGSDDAKQYLMMIS